MIPIFQVDAFAEKPFAGNPAAVVLDARGLSDRQMQAIAAEMNLAGTAFLTPARGSEGAHWHLRWFTPKREVTYSGHTTLAAVHALLEAGRLPRLEESVQDATADLARAPGAHAASVLGTARPRARGCRAPRRRGVGGHRHHAGS